MSTKRVWIAAAVLGFVTGHPAAIAAETDRYPKRPVRFVVPFPSGGSYDVIARLVAQPLSEKLSQQVVVDNRPGAGGVIGTDVFIYAPADGYTLGMFGNPQTIAANVNPNVKWDPVTDITPIATLASLTNVVVVHPSVPAESLSDLIRIAKAKPGSLNYASGGVGATSHLAGELLQHAAGIKLTHVPYKGAAAALTDLSSGRVQTMVLNMVVALRTIKAGKVVPLAVASVSRSPFLPDVQSAAEAGLPALEFSQWYSVVAPAGLPEETRGVLYKNIDEIRRSKDFQAGLLKQGAEPFLLGQRAFSSYVEQDLAKYERIVRQSGIKTAKK